ncbi:MAG: hypothetical protein PVI01_13045 [Gemmatimonadales bacterium]|jgi:hypothetical protein
MTDEKEELAADNESPKPIWASWQIGDDGGISVVATYAEGGRYVRREGSFESLERAAASLGHSFREVVTRAVAAGSRRGRWRP